MRLHHYSVVVRCVLLILHLWASLARAYFSYDMTTCAVENFDSPTHLKLLRASFSLGNLARAAMSAISYEEEDEERHPLGHFFDLKDATVRSTLWDVYEHVHAMAESKLVPLLVFCLPTAKTPKCNKWDLIRHFVHTNDDGVVEGALLLCPLVFELPLSMIPCHSGPPPLGAGATATAPPNRQYAGNRTLPMAMLEGVVEGYMDSGRRMQPKHWSAPGCRRLKLEADSDPDPEAKVGPLDNPSSYAWGALWSLDTGLDAFTLHVKKAPCARQHFHPYFDAVRFDIPVIDDIVQWDRYRKIEV
ncbi:MAG: hypothetical protein M1833_003093 [Piccolia ochrophora]|nr:MAG: hypothetical protein M1833_003093 [Piccolia ochrophora]